MKNKIGRKNVECVVLCKVENTLRTVTQFTLNKMKSRYLNLLTFYIKIFFKSSRRDFGLTKTNDARTI
jgi:hypothetical protein